MYSFLTEKCGMYIETLWNSVIPDTSVQITFFGAADKCLNIWKGFVILSYRAPPIAAI
jgi:hypothetical protein